MADSALAKVTYQSGDIIFMEGDVGDATYLVQSGKVELIKRGPDGLFDTIATIGPGQVFGEVALLTDRPRAAGARAATDCLLIAVERGQLDAKLEKSDPFIRALFRILAQNLLSVMDRKTEIETAPKEEDLAALSSEAE
ncbi:MAG: Crp/Fnr family transcriptional regulator [Alphaproteobacteria bacterium]|nr:Crp/Fnr family transcriptional regulator [Alphaproteobacteria bacterium]